MINYENRVVLFLDILGFKSIIDKTCNSSGEDIPENINELYNVLNSMTEDFVINEKRTSKIVTQFSDSIVISFKEDEKEGIFILFEEIQNLIVKLLSKRIICRGAISYGKLIHNKDMIFGPALVDAYETETKAAMYPRVILDKSIVDIGRKYRSYKGKMFDDKTANNVLEYLTTQNLSKDTDEKYYIDYFASVVRNNNNSELIKNHIENLRTIIIFGLKHKSPDLKVKYGWMKNKYNVMLDNFKKNSLVEFSTIKNKELFNYLLKLNNIN